MLDRLDLMARDLNRLSFIPYEEVRKISSFLFFQKIPKGDLLLRPGDDPRKIYFITRGLFKNFYLSSDGREYISSFNQQGDMMSAYYEIVSQIPSVRYIQALEYTELFHIDFDKFSKIIAGNIYWTDLVKKIIERKFAEKENKERDLMLKSAEERYYKFKVQNQDLIKRLPQNQIALYLGINPSTLSRLKKRAC